MTLLPKLFSLALLLSPAPSDPVQVDEMTQPETKPVILIKMAPNWMEDWGYDMEKYGPALDERLTGWYTDFEFEVSMGVKDEHFVAQVRGDINEKLREEFVEAVTDHFFDEYTPEVG